MKMPLMLLLLVGACSADLDSPSISAADKWPTWKEKFDKVYTSVEDAIAFKKFASTDEKIVAHNAKGDTYTMGHNQFSAMTPDEFKDQIVGHADMRNPGPYDFADLSHIKVANDTAIDWVAKGAVTEVKDQGACGSCWAFSTVGSIEGAYQIAGNPLTAFSVQELVSCDKKGHGGKDQGCNGGLMQQAFDWIHNVHGMCTEKSYPYEGLGSAQCLGGREGPKCRSVANITGYKNVKNETDLLQALTIGPVTVGIEADKNIFQNYKAGVIGAAGKNACGGGVKNLDHGVLIVGAGIASALPKYPGNHPYWNIKNSWGASYGEKGYVRIARGLDECGVADGPPAYPTGVHHAGPKAMK